MSTESHEEPDGKPPHPCCIPSKARRSIMLSSAHMSTQRRRATTGSTEGMIILDGGRFLMGTEFQGGFPADGEGPVREVTLDPFYIDAGAVTNAQFKEFVDATRYETEAQRFGWSFVFHNQLPVAQYDELADDTVLGLEWWCKVDGADWAHPIGPESSVEDRESYPVVHVSWGDAFAYCDWAGKRLPSESEWEYAARGGLKQKLYAWGDDLTPGGRHLCNIWQGEFPDRDTAEDGYAGLSPIDAFDANGYGLVGVAGNAWEWCGDWWSPDYHLHATRTNPTGPADGDRKVTRGGSFLCHESYCNRYRVAARTANTPDSSTINTTFRCARDV